MQQNFLLYSWTVFRFKNPIFLTKMTKELEPFLVTTSQTFHFYFCITFYPCERNLNK